MEPPFASAHQLLRAELDSSDPSPQRLPGWPRPLGNGQPDVLQVLRKEFCSDDLDRMADRLWWMSKQDSRNISALHRQSVKRRTIIVTEDPKLHLVWIQDRIFIKPLPRYITSQTFWRNHLGHGKDSDAETERLRARVRKAALGYLRTYHYLVRHESDFRIAQDPGLQLVPAGVTWAQFCDFAADLAGIPDRDVSTRYSYGEIRLTRLNFYAPIILRKSHFQRVEYQYGSYFARFYGPILFVIGVTSVVLSGLQVAVEVDKSPPLSAVALWFSVVMILLFCIVLFTLCGMFVYKVVKEWKYAIRDRLRLMEEGRLKPE
ncbi:hypothetical protein CMUS01_08632 [Colletotrichum musicola]|uniref:Subtilisin-like serine protease n=1 Tax=Colletotrichum musicola TaxID=2175873 RepID=A0A8H6KAZ1_9PEZI|nr:hypothetical protein CMUS01_08632 [Colletotrichum musicola]